jgi:hypothetical protein
MTAEVREQVRNGVNPKQIHDNDHVLRREPK